MALSGPRAWLVDLTSWQPAFESRAWAFVTPAERVRIGACLDSSERVRRLVGQLMVRSLATAMLGISWQNVSIVRDGLGKPYIREAPWLYFNLSHSGSYVLVAFARSPIGVDIERRRPIAEGFLHYALTADEYGYVIQAGDPNHREERFLRVWTRKESYFKAIGTGLTNNWRQISFASGHGPYQVCRGWRFTDWTIASEYVAAVCCGDPKTPALQHITALGIMRSLGPRPE